MSQHSSLQIQRGELAHMQFRRLPLVMWLALCLLPELAMAALVLTPTQVAAAPLVTTYTVTKTTDTNDSACNADCSLREAVRAANATPGDDTIILPAGIYYLTLGGAGEDAAATGDLDITGNVTIMGAGAGSTIIDGLAADRVFNIIAPVAVSISGLTARNGILSGAGGGIFISSTLASLTLSDSIVSGNRANAGNAGGGIANYGVLTVTNSVVSNNASTYGGGIFSQGSRVAVTNSTLNANQASYGGGVYNKTGTFGITSTMILSNTASTGGGGINNYLGGTVTVVGSTVRGNTAALLGGGVNVDSGQVTLTGSAVISNSVTSVYDVYGGGIYNNSGALVIVNNSTLGGNSAHANNTCDLYSGCSTTYESYGGGIFNMGTTLLVNSTVNFNSASYQTAWLTSTAGWGAGLRNQGTAVFNNTIIAHSWSPTGLGSVIETSNCSFIVASVTNGNNLDSGNTCGFTNPTDKVSMDPRLGTLKYYGSAPPVYPLQSGSPAIDSGSNSACLTTDQRGFPRPVDGDGNGTATCDIGAFEAPVNLFLPAVMR